MQMVSSISDNGFFEEGEYIVPIKYCKEHFCEGKCAIFYQQLPQKTRNHFYTCPYGMSVFLSNDGTIFTCMRERKTYSKKAAKSIAIDDEKVYNQILDEMQLLKLIEATVYGEKEGKIIEEKRRFVDSVTHEARQLNAQIKAKSDSLLTTYKLNEGINLSKEDMLELQRDIRTIYASSSIIASRFSLYDYEKNPQALTQGSTVSCAIYKVFDKMSKILQNYQGRNVPIVIEGTSYEEMQVHPLFEMIPFSIIENAVKYTYSFGSGNDVKIVFSHTSDNHLQITVSSYSPYCSEEESKLIFQKGYRAKNAQRASAGSGIGLFFTKMLCDAHNIDISAFSDRKRVTEITGVAYAPFRITLVFNDVVCD